MTRRASFIIVVAAVLACSDAVGGESLPKDCAVLPLSQGRHLIEQCSRASPANVTGFWTPSITQVLAVEQRLPALLSKSGHKIDLSRTRRQYVGIISGGKKLIYLNALLAEAPDPHDDTDWRSVAVMVCDGGDAFWGVEFDPTDNAFHNLGFNGEA
jgi:hypothetical protein